MGTGIGTRRSGWVWICIGLCVTISASGNSSHWTAGISWNHSQTGQDIVKSLREGRQLGLWNNGEQRRGKRSAEACPNNLYPDAKTSLCCKKCPAGSYVTSSCVKNGEMPVCKRCPKDTYLAFENYNSKCQSCTLCDKEFQIVLRNCSADNNTVCGCQPHQFKQCHHVNCLSFYCQNCSKCNNRHITKICLNNSDAQCGQCLPGFYEHGNQCKACTEAQCKNDSSANCSRCTTPEPPLAHTGLKSVLILAIVGCLFILLVMLQFLRLKFQRESPDKLEILTVTASEEVKTIKNEDKNIPFEIPDGKSDIIVEVMTQPLANCNIYGTSPQQTLVQPETQAAMTLDGKTLYEVINVVPVRRWKELMRLLELRDCDIERIEMDVAQSRDQQYEMLRQWSQQQASSMESVYQALESMNLSGIVEELQNKLLHKTNSPR
ncbi:tumor necrosis factor receptor superfamily member 25-like [Rhincodon typus]|uniref:tumor necrosis factor receptor superfamily member 25-like n=1 Tax=Rhincodon typus TaxID=259920 RepID=UPI0009A44E80|nr:tumor necrosis factor receptor superfamily member 25-like [Rhincodon typus]